MAEMRNALQERPQGAMPSNTEPNPRADIKAITTRSGIVLDGPLVPPPLPSSKEVEREPKTIKDQKKLSLPDLTPTRMTLELATRSIAYPVGIAEDVCIQVGKFTFLADFVVVDYDVDPRVSLILGRPFLRMAHALVDVYGEELILRDGDEKLIFHADSTSKHTYKHRNESINMINFIEITCEDHFEEVLKIKKPNHPLSGSPTPSSDPVDFQDSPDDEEDTRSSHEYLNDLEEEYQARALLAKSKRFFKKGTQSSPQHKPELRPTKDFEAKYNKVKAKLALLSSSASASKASTDFQDSPDDEEDTRSSHEYLNDLEEEYQARALLAKSKRFFKKGTQRFSSAKATDQTECHKYGKKDEEEVSLDDNEMVEVKVFMALPEDNDVVSKEGARNSEWVKISMRKLLVLKQAKLDFITMHHVNTEILKENKNLSTELKELTVITKTWLNSSNKVNKCIIEQIPSQKKRILGVDQLTEDPSNSGQKDLVFVKSLVDDTKVSIPGVERPWLFKAEGFILPNHDTGRILPAESQRNTNDPSVAVTDFSATDYDYVDESSVCSTLLPPLKKLDGAEPISGPKTIKSILSSSVSKVNSAHAGKLKSVKIEDDPPLAIVIKELNNLKLQFSKSQSSYSRSNQPLQCEKTDHRTCDHAEYISTMNMSQHLKSLGRASSRSNIPRPSKRFFPPCTHYGRIDHLSNEYHPRNPQLTFKRCEVCGSLTHTTTNHYDIELFKRGEAIQAKKAEALKSARAESSNANRSKTPTRRITYVEKSGPKVVFGDDSTCTTEGYGSIKCNGIVFTKVAFVNGLKYNLISISQLYDAKYIVQFDEKRGTIFNSNKEVVMIALIVRDVYVLDMTSSAQDSCFFAKAFENFN
ncbi:retrovirus-related pol polyprotein from transposon TNT 1-94 [Tanacetum coccineum]|uniref:Retrovirus-related pol polyprotein from transposon TNT 1-94 n=1 Tax=Tanacetum coccineum TaxID=301880 RepID=A0ABQ5BT70_9ASTR